MKLVVEDSDSWQRKDNVCELCGDNVCVGGVTGGEVWRLVCCVWLGGGGRGGDRHQHGCQ